VIGQGEIQTVKRGRESLFLSFFLDCR
jgi:hypothetical protein